MTTTSCVISEFLGGRPSEDEIDGEIIGVGGDVAIVQTIRRFHAAIDDFLIGQEVAS